MKTIRHFAFPIALAAAWLFVSAHTLTALTQMNGSFQQQQRAHQQQAPSARA